MSREPQKKKNKLSCHPQYFRIISSALDQSCKLFAMSGVIYTNVKKENDVQINLLQDYQNMLYLLYMHITVNMLTGLLSARLGCSQSSKRKIHLTHSPVHSRTFYLQNDQTRDCYLLLSWQHCRNLVQGLEHPRFYVYYGFGHLQFHALDTALRTGIL